MAMTRHPKDTEHKDEREKAPQNADDTAGNNAKGPKKTALDDPQLNPNVVAKGRKEVEARTFTYIGGGADSPRSINFMGKQKFVRGKSVEVKDPEVIAKLEGNPTFIEGEADDDLLDQIDEDGKTEEEKQQRRDLIKNQEYVKKHKTEK